MALKVTCSCGATAIVKDEYAGRTGQCRACKALITVGQASPAATATAPPLQPTPRPAAADPFFHRHKFLLRQKHLAINEKYAVWDEDGAPILFVERPAHLLRNLLALFGGLGAGGVIITLLAFTYQAIPEALQMTYIVAAVPLTLAAVILVYVRLEMKRHVEFYQDESRRLKVLRIMQDRKFAILSATFTITDAAGQKVGTFRKNYLYDLIRKQWQCHDHGGALLFIAREDSILKAILRRLLGPLFGLLRQNFIFCEPQSGNVLGEFNRSFTLLDRYVLDMSPDAGSRIDRRLALAMGVMLDSGERR